MSMRILQVGDAMPPFMFSLLFTQDIDHVNKSRINEFINLSLEAKLMQIRFLTHQFPLQIFSLPLFF